MVYVGNISYSVYLWHLPILLLLQAFFAPGSSLYYLSVLSLTAVISVLSYHLLERPMRYAPWLMTPPERRRMAKRPRNFTRVRNGWIAVGAALATGLVLWSLTPSQPPSSPAARLETLPEPGQTPFKTTESI